MRPRVLVARLDSDGDVLLAGPAIRAVRAGARHVTLLVGPRGQQAARLLPAVDDVLVWRCPWIDATPDPVRRDDVEALVDRLARGGHDEALVLTSFHQSPLPAALLLRMAGIGRIGAASTDYPGSLLDVRHRLPETGLHEVERGLSTAAAFGYPRPAGDDGRLALRGPLPDPTAPQNLDRPTGKLGNLTQHVSEGRAVDQTRARAGHEEASGLNNLDGRAIEPQVGP